MILIAAAKEEKSYSMYSSAGLKLQFTKIITKKH